MCHACVFCRLVAYDTRSIPYKDDSEECPFCSTRWMSGDCAKLYCLFHAITVSLRCCCFFHTISNRKLCIIAANNPLRYVPYVVNPIRRCTPMPLHYPHGYGCLYIVDIGMAHQYLFDCFLRLACFSSFLILHGISMIDGRSFQPWTSMFA